MNEFPTRRNALAGFLAFAVPSLAFGLEAGRPSGDPLTVELTGIGLPVVRNGVHINYLFGVINIKLGDMGSTLFLRENSYLLRDAIIKIASRAPIPEGPTPKSFDRVAITRVVLQAIQAVRPNARVIQVTVLEAAFMRS